MLSSSRRKQLAPILSVGFLLLVWFVASLLVSSNLLLPGPGETIAEFTKILSSARGWSNIVETCSKAFIGLFLALGMAMVTGFLMGLIDVLYELLRPLVVILQSIPIVSWLALAIFWWGVGFSSPVYIVLLTLFPIFTINIAEGVRNVDKKLVEMAKVYRLSRKVVLRKIYLSSAFPFIVSSMRVGVGIMWKSVAVAEFMVGASGIGRAMSDAKYSINTTRVFAYTLILVILGILTEKLLDLLIGRSARYALKN
ncbi:MAG TPA: ABC transporter permease [Mesotoga sp.]|jgi:NitT/TauT family transport system permease protein|uniref:ABC transporter permease n=1 Tax=unclassified Mesotoga TaxID=1184398 RepID=UPI001BD4F3F3|nr:MULTISPECIES: ABC transporter permease [unclassified Mesotoga]MDD3461405.1 ABC transporter permease [Mesotoga sp.]HNU23313.1 ABC transporter permease [Mesotoga sp.]